jgi:hypothetical protein
MKALTGARNSEKQKSPLLLILGSNLVAIQGKWMREERVQGRSAASVPIQVPCLINHGFTGRGRILLILASLCQALSLAAWGEDAFCGLCLHLRSRALSLLTHVVCTWVLTGAENLLTEFPQKEVWQLRTQRCRGEEKKLLKMIKLIEMLTISAKELVDLAL